MHSRWIALGVVVMGVAALFDVHSAAPAPGAGDSVARESAMHEGFHPQLSVLHSARISPRRNVMLLVLDSMPGALAAEIAQSDPALAERFAGFTAYRNASMADCTKRGLPGLMTGRFFEPGTDPSEFPMSVYGGDSFLVDAVRHGDAVYFVPDMLPYGYTNRIVDGVPRPSGRQRRGWSVLLLRSREVPFLSVADVTAFRIIPFALKSEFLYAKIRHDPLFERDESNFWHDHVMFPTLSLSPLAPDDAEMLGVFHSWGSHMPRYFDADGRPEPHPSFGYDDLVMATSNSLARVAAFLDSLREKGVYERSFIVISADHGSNHMPCAAGHDATEDSILWVKPDGAATAPLAFSRVATTSANIAALMRKAVAGPLGVEEAAAIVASSRRRFIASVRKGGRKFFREWIVDGEDNVLETREWDD